eukprot:gene5190-2403_t
MAFVCAGGTENVSEQKRIQVDCWNILSWNTGGRSNWIPLIEKDFPPSQPPPEIIFVQDLYSGFAPGKRICFGESYDFSLSRATSKTSSYILTLGVGIKCQCSQNVTAITEIEPGRLMLVHLGYDTILANVYAPQIKHPEKWDKFLGTIDTVLLIHASFTSIIWFGDFNAVLCVSDRDPPPKDSVLARMVEWERFVSTREWERLFLPPPGSFSYLPYTGDFRSNLDGAFVSGIPKKLYKFSCELISWPHMDHVPLLSSLGFDSEGRITLSNGLTRLNPVTDENIKDLCVEFDSHVSQCSTLQAPCCLSFFALSLKKAVGTHFCPVKNSAINNSALSLTLHKTRLLAVQASSGKKTSKLIQDVNLGLPPALKITASSASLIVMQARDAYDKLIFKCITQAMEPPGKTLKKIEVPLPRKYKEAQFKRFWAYTKKHMQCQSASISSAKTSTGITNNPDLVKQATTDYIGSLVGSSGPSFDPSFVDRLKSIWPKDKVISEVQKAYLMRPITGQEISVLVGKKDTAPGPNLITNKLLRRLPASFFDQLAHVFNNTLVASWSSTTGVRGIWSRAEMIGLLKCPPQFDLSNWRFLALSNVDQKLFNAVLINRLQQII